MNLLWPSIWRREGVTMMCWATFYPRGSKWFARIDVLFVLFVPIFVRAA